MNSGQAYRALYIHIPFCKQRCAYCDFETNVAMQGTQEMRSYAEQLCLEVMRASRAGELKEIETIYIGGGTPSYLDSGSLSQLLYTLSLALPTNPAREWTMEANPDSVDERLIRDIWALGVNRLSIGVQSFNDEELRTLGRVHDSQAATQAITCAQTRFENVSIDLMCGIPGQTVETFEQSILQAIALGVTHVSVYPLTIEEGTPFDTLERSGTLPPIDEDLQALCMQLAAQYLCAAGFARYEVASYALPGFACKHNCAYWTGVPYLGLGRSAVSMSQDAKGRKRMQDGNVVDVLTPQEALAEDLMLGMRMTQGISAEMLAKAQAVFPNSAQVFAQLKVQGLVAEENGRLVPTETGWLFGNTVFEALLSLASQ